MIKLVWFIAAAFGCSFSILVAADEPIGGGEKNPVCYVPQALDCKSVLFNMINFEDEPIRISCGPCVNSVCPSKGQNTVVPDLNTTINWATGYPLGAGGPNNGRKSFRNDVKAKCGEIRKCGGCVIFEGEDLCKPGDVVKDFEVYERILTGDGCKAIVPIP